MTPSFPNSYVFSAKGAASVRELAAARFRALKGTSAEGAIQLRVDVNYRLQDFLEIRDAAPAKNEAALSALGIFRLRKPGALPQAP